MPLSAGEKLGPYEIVEPIGKGGMGEVYGAHDPRLKRDVAIKVSAAQFSERFEREARAVAALNHPNICTLHDVGPNYLVMELVEGPTLAERIKAGALPIEEALDIARQIIAALEAAHDKGITHRDLKPANVKIKSDGLVKVLDFGLAKVAPTATTSGIGEDSPTLSMVSMAATKAGVILGTAAYMSPEQARGKTDIDKRADIWAFGVVLYEMVTGKRLFTGEDLTEVLAAVVMKDPDLREAPAELRLVLEMCLRKDPKKRLRDISGVELLLEKVGTQVPQRQPASRPSWVPWAAAAAMGVVAVAVSLLHFRETPTTLQAIQFSLSAPPGTTYTNTGGGYAPSPDGRYVVFTARTTGAPQLWLRPLDSGVARPLPGTESANFPTWSPDSRSLAFFSENKIKRIDIDGGAPLTLGAATAPAVSPTGTWNRAGVILFGSAAGLQRVSAAGGGESLLTKVDASKETGHGYPQFLPDGNRFLYFVASADPGVQGVYASSLDHPDQRTQIVRTDAKAVYVPPRSSYPGYLLWMQENTLLAQRFDADKLERQGDPVSVAEGIDRNSGPQSVRAHYWASDAGMLIYFSNVGGTTRPVVWFTRDGKQSEAVPAGVMASISLAPGADRIALQRQDGGANADVWVREFARGVMTRLTFDAAADALPVWSPDGKWIAFSSDREGGLQQVYRKEASGAGQDERLTEGPTSKQVLHWSRDGRFLLYRDNDPKTGRDLMALPLEGNRKPIPVVHTQFMESTGAISPDGRWVAYASNDSGDNEVYVQAFPGSAGGPSGRWQISTGGGYDVKWRGDGRELYYVSPNSEMMAVAVKAGPQGIQAETPRALFSPDFTYSNLRQFDVTPDGQRFVMVVNAQAQSGATLTVVANWQAALRK